MKHRIFFFTGFPCVLLALAILGGATLGTLALAAPASEPEPKKIERREIPLPPCFGVTLRSPSAAARQVLIQHDYRQGTRQGDWLNTPPVTLQMYEARRTAMAFQHVAVETCQQTDQITALHLWGTDIKAIYALAREKFGLDHLDRPAKDFTLPAADKGIYLREFAGNQWLSLTENGKTATLKLEDSGLLEQCRKGIQSEKARVQTLRKDMEAEEKTRTAKDF